MLKFIYSVVIGLLSLSAIAQHTLTGYVRDQLTNQPLAGAAVKIKGSGHFTVTDDLGQFRFDNLPEANYRVSAKYLGYTEKEELINFTKDSEVILRLEQTYILTDEIVVTATRASDKTPTTFTTITKDKIEHQNFGQDLPLLLNWTPSVVTTSDAGTGIGYTGIRIRGSDGTRINVTINGIPYNDSESQGTYWVDIPDISSSLQSMQVQRGVGSSTNGAGAFGASINLQTGKRNDNPYAELINSFGSFNSRRHTLSLGTGLLKNHWVIDGRVSKIASDGFIDRASADLQSYYFSAGFYTTKTVLKAISFGGKERTYQSWYGVPESRLKNDSEAMLTTALNEGWNQEQTDNLLNSNSRTFNPYLYKNQVDDYQQTHYQLHFSHRMSSSVTVNTALHYTPGKGYYEEYRYDDAFSNYGLPPVTIGNSTVESSDIIRRRWLDNDFYGFTYSATMDKNEWNIVYGGAWNRYDGDHFGEIIWTEVTQDPTKYRYYFNNGDKRDFNTYLKANYQVSSNFNVYADLQYRKVLFHTSGIENKLNQFDISNEFNFFNPKAGFIFSVATNHQLYASYSVGNREPVRDDFVDNPGSAPKHETLHNLEVGYRGTGNQHTFHINYYLMDYRNQLVLTGKLNDVGASVRTNVESSYRTGIEIEGLFKLSAKVQWNSNLTLSSNRIKNFTEVLYDYGTNFDEYNSVERSYKNTDISFSPNVIASSSLSFFPVKGFELTLLTKYVGKQYLDNTSNNKRRIDAYFTNDIRLGYTWKPSFIREINFGLLINNVLNEKYESNGYTWGYLGGGSEYRENYYYPQAGTNLMGMITIKL